MEGANFAGQTVEVWQDVATVLEPPRAVQMKAASLDHWTSLIKDTIRHSDSYCKANVVHYTLQPQSHSIWFLELDFFYLALKLMAFFFFFSFL